MCKAEEWSLITSWITTTRVLYIIRFIEGTQHCVRDKIPTFTQTNFWRLPEELITVCKFAWTAQTTHWLAPFVILSLKWDSKIIVHLLNHHHRSLLHYPFHHLGRTTRCLGCPLPFHRSQRTQSFPTLEVAPEVRDFFGFLAQTMMVIMSTLFWCQSLLRSRICGF